MNKQNTPVQCSKTLSYGKPNVCWNVHAYVSTCTIAVCFNITIREYLNLTELLRVHREGFWRRSDFLWCGRKLWNRDPSGPADISQPSEL